MLNSRAGHVTTNGALIESHVRNRPAVLDHDALFRVAPSIFATEPWGAMSDRYGFVPTIDVVGRLAGEGYYPVRAEQSRSRIEGKSDFTRHMVRFRHQDFLQPMTVGTEFPEVVLVNSHDGACTLEFLAGIFRLWCSNGAVCPVGDSAGFKIRHNGSADFMERVIGATMGVVENTGLAMGKMVEWKEITLDRSEQLALAGAAIELRNATLPIKPEQLLATRRTADLSPDLWTVENVIQENLIRGGIRTRNATGRRATTRAVGSVNEDIRLNKGLWILSQAMADLKR